MPSKNREAERVFVGPVSHREGQTTGRPHRQSACQPEKESPKTLRRRGGSHSGCQSLHSHTASSRPQLQAVLEERRACAKLIRLVYLRGADAFHVAAVTTRRPICRSMRLACRPHWDPLGRVSHQEGRPDRRYQKSKGYVERHPYVENAVTFGKSSDRTFRSGAWTSP